jgi:hypothetical protein
MLADLAIGEIPPLQLVAGDDTTLVLAVVGGCEGDGVFIMPSDGSSPPRRLVDTVGDRLSRGDVSIAGDYVYFSRAGSVSRVCRRLQR